MKSIIKVEKNLKGFILLLAVFAGLVGGVAAQTKTTTKVKRNFFYPGLYKETNLGKALVANAVNSSVGADIAFAALADTLSMGVEAGIVVASGGSALASHPVTGYVIGKGVGEAIEFLRNKKAQLPRLSKFRRTDATYLQYDSGKWCIIPNGPSLSVIRGDALDPMLRTDIPANAADQLCRMPDGFYLGSDGRTVYMNYSSKNTDESWYGIGFGDSFCGVSSEALWQELVKKAFINRLGTFDEYNIRQPTLIRMSSDQNVNLSRGRKDTGLCTMNNTTDVGVSNTDSSLYRNIIFPDHFKTSGHGAALVAAAKGTNVLGDVLTSEAAEFVTGVAGVPFYGTGAQITSALSDPDTSLPKMVKRPNNDTVYLQFDNESFCAMDNPDLLSIMRGGVLEVAKSSRIPGNVQPGAVPVCGFPDGFFKAPDNAIGQNIDKQVYYLFSSSANNPAWYGMGFGDSYCKIPSEDVWRRLINFAGGDGGAPQDSLIRVSTVNLFKNRTEKPCPTNVVNGIAK